MNENMTSLLTGGIPAAIGDPRVPFRPLGRRDHGAAVRGEPGLYHRGRQRGRAQMYG